MKHRILEVVNGNGHSWFYPQRKRWGRWRNLYFVKGGVIRFSSLEHTKQWANEYLLEPTKKIVHTVDR